MGLQEDTDCITKKKNARFSHNQPEIFCILNKGGCKTGLINRQINAFEQFSAESV